MYSNQFYSIFNRLPVNNLKNFYNRCGLLSSLRQVHRGGNGAEPVGGEGLLQALVAGQALGGVLPRHAQPQGRGEGVPALPVPVAPPLPTALPDRGAPGGSRQGQGDHRDEVCREVAPQLIGVTALFLSFSLPLYQWRLRFLQLFQIEELREGLAKAREIIEMKFVEKWRRSL